ncbi:MAG: Ni/Fe hydrogenase subunit alpha [Planctomycetes bacterium]|nr:Ni/Fe hydrogenase subunit alpha [Planctomycetota bacterium]
MTRTATETKCRTIVVEPVTRLEGHGKVTISLDDNGDVADARFHVTEFRGFEKFCEGRMVWEMPVITERACGICPVSHHLASAKACDALFGVEPPRAGTMLRELMHMGQMIHSHALHFFYLAAPDLVLGPDCDPATRNVVGLAAADPQLVKKAVRLRTIGQDIIEQVAGRSIHPAAAIPGGMAKALSHAERHEVRAMLDEALPIARLALDLGKRLAEQQAELFRRIGIIRTRYAGLTKDGALELYDGRVRIIDERGLQVADFAPAEYLEHVGERVEEWSYLKFPYHKAAGWPDGVFRVNSLARLNIADRISTPEADRELKWFKSLADGPVHDTMYYHPARLVETLHCIERARELIDDPEIVSPRVRVKIERREGEGVGVIEAPRGTLYHHYWADALGRVQKVNLIVATVQNNPAMNLSVAATAREFIKGGEVSEGLLNRVEMAIRAYDPCLSCATHAVGQMPLSVEILRPDGSGQRLVRDGG